MIITKTTKSGDFLGFLGGLGRGGGAKKGVPDEELINTHQKERGMQAHLSMTIWTAITGNTEHGAARGDVEERVGGGMKAPLVEPAMEGVTPAHE
ncbi:MAG: hypothetical protein ACTJLK_02365 [Anaplasma sp.]